VERKLGVDLGGRPTMVTARAFRPALRDARFSHRLAHQADHRADYMNNEWEAKTGRLRLLRGPNDLDDVIAEVPPDEGTMLIFKNEPMPGTAFTPSRGRAG